MLFLLNAGRGIACCVSPFHTFSEVLLDETSDYDLFVVTIDSSWYSGEWANIARGKVRQVYRGQLAEEVIIHSGGNTSAGGMALLPGASYLIVSRSTNNYEYHAFVCDSYSAMARSEKQPPRGRAYKHHLITDQYWDLKKKSYTGKVKLKADGQLFAEGQMENGKPSGTWNHFVMDGDAKRVRSTVLYQAGLRHGICKYRKMYQLDQIDKQIVYDHGIKRVESHYENNQLKQKQSYTYPDLKHVMIEESIYGEKGSLIEHQFTYGSSEKYLNPHIYNSQRKDSVYQHFYANGQIKTTGKYYQGAKIGWWISYDSLGNNLDSSFWEKPEEIDMDEVSYYDNGIIALKGNYVDGQRDGLWVSYCQGGVPKIKANYSIGKLHGLYTKHRCLDGSIYLETHYQDDLKHGQEIGYARDGKTIVSSGDYINNQENGVFRNWFDNGQLRQELTWEKGKREGPLRAYNSDGTVHKIGTYSNDFLEGYYVQYLDGGIKDKGNYDKGNKIGEWQINYPRKNIYNLYFFDYRTQEEIYRGQTTSYQGKRPISFEEYVSLNAKDPNFKPANLKR